MQTSSAALLGERIFAHFAHLVMYTAANFYNRAACVSLDVYTTNVCNEIFFLDLNENLCGIFSQRIKMELKKKTQSTINWPDDIL